MRLLTVLLVVGSATSAQAHPGHLADLAGHDHWVAGAAIGLAILAGLYGALTGKSEDAEVEDDEEAVAEEEVPA